MPTPLPTILLAALALPAAAYDARLTAVDGTVHVQRRSDADDAWYPAETGTPLEAEDRVRVADGGRAELALESGTVFSVEGGSEIVVDAPDKDVASLSLLWGTVLAKLDALVEGRRFIVRTPNAVAAVRGTEFAVTYDDADNASHVGVFEDGEVAVFDVDAAGVEERVLTANQELTWRDGPGEVRRGLKHHRARRARMKRMRERLHRLRADWKTLSAAERRALRGRILHRERLVRLKLDGRRAEMRLRHLKRMHKRRAEVRKEIRRRIQQRREKAPEKARKKARKKVRERVREKVRQRRGGRDPR